MAGVRDPSRDRDSGGGAHGAKVTASDLRPPEVRRDVRHPPVPARRLVSGGRDPNGPHARGLGRRASSPGRRAPRPSFGELREHVASRLCRARRATGRSCEAPRSGIGRPVWVDDESFDIARHVVRARSRRLPDVVAWFMSKPLSRDRPLWQICIADLLEDGRIGVVGKAHHCMVDGIAAVELATLMSTRPRSARARAGPVGARGRRPARPSWSARALGDFARRQLDAGVDAGAAGALARSAAWRSPCGPGASAARAPGRGAARPASSSLNPPISPLRQLGLLARPIEDLLEIKRAFGVKLNDVVLAVCAGAVRELLRGRGERPIRLKSMVPVNVRSRRGAASWATGSRSCSSTFPATSRIRSAGCARSMRRPASESSR